MSLPGKVSMKTSSRGKEKLLEGVREGAGFLAQGFGSQGLTRLHQPGVYLTLQLAWRSASLEQGMAASGSLCAAIDTFLLASVSP